MRNHSAPPGVLIIARLAAGDMSVLAAPDIQITVQADHVRHSVSRYLTGACIEGVNYEIYGGVDSQMIFGESFTELRN